MISTCNGILAQVQLYPSSYNKKNARIVGSMPDLTYPHGFLDGAIAHKIRRAGIFLGISQSHSFSIKLGCGFSTNSRAELLSLWNLLYFAIAIGIPTLHVFWDSFVVINWENDKVPSQLLTWPTSVITFLS